MTNVPHGQIFDSHQPSCELSTTFPDIHSFNSASHVSHESDDGFIIPFGHRTASTSLFAFPQIRNMIGDYPENTFLRIESQRTFNDVLENASPISELLRSIDHRRETTEALVTQFFSHVHPHLPILDYDTFLPTYESFIRHGAHNNSETALCMMVLALGRLSSNINQTQDLEADSGKTGEDFFHVASRMIFREWSFTIIPKISLVTGLVYGALYLCYLTQPLQAWRYIHMASTSLQTIASG